MNRTEQAAIFREIADMLENKDITLCSANHETFLKIGICPQLEKLEFELECYETNTKAKNLLDKIFLRAKDI